MRTTMDGAGRVVVPKALREAIGLADGGEVELQLIDGSLLVSSPTVAKRLELRDGRATIVAEEDVAPLSDRTVRDVLDATRR